MEDRELEFDDVITNDGEPFEPLEPGDYQFKIINYERSQYEPSANSSIPRCKMATVHFEIIVPGGETRELKENYHMHTKMEWKLSQLFASVGLKKKGEPLRMDWNALPGLTGKCKIKQVPGYKDPTKTYNQIERLYPGEGAAPAFTPGSF